jgi:hypothetical protein
MVGVKGWPTRFAFLGGGGRAFKFLKVKLMHALCPDLKTGRWKNMRRISLLAAVAAALFCAATASAQTKVFDFEDGTDQGWGSSFGGPDDSSHAIVNIGGSNRMQLNLGGFQVGSVNSSANPYLAAMNTAMANPGVSTISYDWYVDTAGFTGATFLQIGTYINSGQNPFSYRQDFDTPANRAELDGTQLASGMVFSGTNSFTVTQRYGGPLQADFLNAPGQRLGLIMNGNGTGVSVYFDNITIVGIPEPASLALLGLAIPAFVGLRRRRS